MLDVHLYEEIEADKSALGQAMTVVVLSSLASGVGLYDVLGVMGLVVGTVGALIGWYIWAFMTYFIGTKLLPEPQTHADQGELLRTIGFSSAPGLIRVLGIIPSLDEAVHHYYCRNLDAGGHGDCRAASLGLSQYITGCWRVPHWMGGPGVDPRAGSCDGWWSA